MEDDAVMAQQLVDGLHWLGDKGRSGAVLVQPLIDHDKLGEAMAWLEDIENRVEL